ncbi:hypothetical protein AAZX31_13G059800 [Glycine max]
MDKKTGRAQHSLVLMVYMHMHIICSNIRILG